MFFWEAEGRHVLDGIRKTVFSFIDPVQRIGPAALRTFLMIMYRLGRCTSASDKTAVDGMAFAFGSKPRPTGTTFDWETRKVSRCQAISRKVDQERPDLVSSRWVNLNRERTSNLEGCLNSCAQAVILWKWQAGLALVRLTKN